MRTILAISGSLRAQSSNRKLLEAMQALAPDAIVIDEGIATLPHFNPDDDEEGAVQPAAVQAFRKRVNEAAAVIISSPEYAHGVPGVLKNALDWLVSAGELVGKPVALINAAPQGGDYAQASLEETLRTMNWNVLGGDAHLTKPFVRRKGKFDDPEVQGALRRALAALMQAAV